MNINEPKGPGSQWTRLDAAQQAVERLEQQVAQLRGANTSLIAEWTVLQELLERAGFPEGDGGLMGQVDAIYTAHTTLRGLVENASYHIEQVEADLHTALNGTRHDPSWIRPIQLSRNERQELYFNCQKQLAAIRATLPREGATSDGGEHE